MTAVSYSYPLHPGSYDHLHVTRDEYSLLFPAADAPRVIYSLVFVANQEDEAYEGECDICKVGLET